MVAPLLCLAAPVPAPVVTLALVGLGAVGGIVAAIWLRGRGYRRDDDELHHSLPVAAVPILSTLLSVPVAVLRADEPIVAGLLVVAVVWFVVLGFIDIEVRRLPDRLVLPGYAVALAGLAAAAWSSGAGEALVRSVACGAIAFAGYLALALIGAGRSGLGLGDVKLAGVLGLLLGWSGWLVAALGMLSGFVVGGLVAGFLLVARRSDRRSHMPFGPAMLIGAYLWLCLPNLSA